MSETPPQPQQTPEKESESDRRLGNIIIAVGLMLLLGIGWWLADAMYLARKADDCLSSGRRNCTPFARNVLLRGALRVYQRRVPEKKDGPVDSQGAT